MAGLNGVVAAVPTDRQTDGSFLVLRIYFENKSAMDAYLSIFRRD